MCAQTSHMIYRPTIASLRDALDNLIEAGWHEDQQIQVKQMANAPEAFSVEAVEVWIWPNYLCEECGESNA
jgi:hypothetical protein